MYHVIQHRRLLEGNKIIGRSDELKTQLADEISRDVCEIAGCEEKSVSISFEEVKPEEWAEKVYKPDILDKAQSLYKKPGYNPFE